MGRLSLAYYLKLTRQRQSRGAVKHWDEFKTTEALRLRGPGRKIYTEKTGWCGCPLLHIKTRCGLKFDGLFFSTITLDFLYVIVTDCWSFTSLFDRITVWNRCLFRTKRRENSVSFSSISTLRFLSTGKKGKLRSSDRTLKSLNRWFCGSSPLGRSGRAWPSNQVSA